MNEYDGAWITTFTGKKFHYLDPQPEEIDIKDIAHHLSLICRFTGACREFYCVAPDERVLTSDLLWSPAGDLIVGQPIIAFEEYPRGLTQAGRRKIKQATITSLGRKRLPSFRVVLGDGTEMVVSEQHKFLTHLGKSRRNVGWRTAQEIFDRFTLKDGRLSSTILLPKYFNVWETDNTYKGGFISASFDGEGHIHTSGGGLGVFYSQKDNAMYHTVCQYLADLDVPFRTHIDPKGVNVVAITGGYQYNLSFLGRFRPPRLLANWAEGNLLNLEASKIDTFPVRAIEFLGKKDVIAIGTSTHTLFTEGYASHNSVAEHSIRVAECVPPSLRLSALLHDAAEAYINDISRPVKHSCLLKATEEGVSKAIATKFRVVNDNPIVKYYDSVLLATEARDLLPNVNGWAGLPEPLDEIIFPWTSEDAEASFLTYFVVYGGQVD